MCKPISGRDKADRAGFIYNEHKQQYECIKEQGNKAVLTYKGIKTDSKGYQKKTYRSSERSCKNCKWRVQCCGQSTKFKKIDDSIDKPYYDRMHEKLTNNARYAKRMVSVRSSTVEPVLGTLINFRNMKRVNTRGIRQANKHILMAALTYNLHKYIRFITRERKTAVQSMQLATKSVKNSVKTMFFEFKVPTYRVTLHLLNC